MRINFSTILSPFFCYCQHQPDYDCVIRIGMLINESGHNGVKSKKVNTTFEVLHQCVTDVCDVLANGIEVIKAGDHTGSTPARFIKGYDYLEIHN